MLTPSTVTMAPVAMAAPSASLATVPASTVVGLLVWGFAFLILHSRPLLLLCLRKWVESYLVKGRPAWGLGSRIRLPKSPEQRTGETFYSHLK